MTVPGAVGVIIRKPIMDGAVRGIGMADNHFKTTSENLGTQMIEGVAAPLGGSETLSAPIRLIFDKGTVMA